MGDENQNPEAPQGVNEEVGADVGQGEAVAPEGAVPPENTDAAESA